MNPSVQLIVQHGYVWLFLLAFLERIGLPLLLTPVMVAAGAVAGLGELSLGWIILVPTIASEIGDIIWYELGRHRGASVLRILCKISLEPDSCVRKSEDRFARHTGSSLFYSKFLPGVGHLAAPIAGLSKMPRDRFLLRLRQALQDSGRTGFWRFDIPVPDPRRHRPLLAQVGGVA